MHKNNKKGFTIVELVIVIAVIAILAAVLIPTFANLAKRANISADTQLIRNLNTALIADSAKNGTHTTMQSALDAAEKFGYDVARINASATDNEILWDSANDVFCYFNAETSKIEYIPETNVTTTTVDNIDYWVISKTYDATKGYSVYLYNYTDASTESAPLVISTGLDTGKESVAFVKYENSTNQTVTIRTNSASTTLIIADSSEGTIYHYGSAGALNIIQCHTASYHENGDIAFAEIATGRIVLESGSEIKHIHVNANEEANGFDTVIIADNGAKALPEAITRDQVDVSEAKAVVTVESGSTSETVYVYPYTDAQEAKTGTTEQTETQNTSIASALGKLVLDNGEDAGEKAMSNNEKTEAKTELVNDAKAPEIAKELEEETTAVVYNLTTGEYYDNLYSAIESVPVNIKTTLVLLKNINGVSNKNYQIDDNQIIVFDLNGHTMNTVAPDGNTAYAIENKGTLTIKDNSDTLKNGTGKGKLELNALNPDLQAIPGYASNLITNMGNLTVESGWLYNASTGTAAYAIDLNSNNGRNVSLVINGGKITTNGSLSIRQQVHTNTTNDVTINGGIIGSFWIQNYGNSSTSANGNLNINGGEFLYKIRLDTGYSIDYGYNIKAENVHVNINGGTFNGTITVNENGNNGQFTIFGGTFNKEITYYGEVKFIRGGTFNVSPVLKSDGYPYATVDGGGFGFYNLTNLLNSAGTTLEDILSLDLETQIGTYGFGLEYWDAPSKANKQYGGSDCYDVVRYVAASYDEYINDGFIAINNNDGTITVVAE